LDIGPGCVGIVPSRRGSSEESIAFDENRRSKIEVNEPRQKSGRSHARVVARIKPARPDRTVKAQMDTPLPMLRKLGQPRL
jgi:hypothetical protein